MMMKTILYVDDEPSNLTVFKFQFRDEFDIRTAESAAHGLQIMKETNVDVVVADQRMPDMTGVEMLARIRETDPQAVRMILTGFSDYSAVVSAINAGQIYYYIEKPWDEEQLRLVLRNAIEVRELEMRNLQLVEELRSANINLTQALKLAEEAGNAKSIFLRNISHEVRTPLNGIIGLTNLFLDSEGKGSISSERLELILMAAEGLLEVMTSALEIANIESGKIEPKNSVFVPRDMVIEACELWAARMQAKKLDLVTNFLEGSDQSVVGDKVHVLQILNNLISNSYKFTEEGKIVVEVACHSTDDCQCTLNVNVSDTGIGVLQQSGESVFDPFFQVDSSTTRKISGPGLGLAICRGLAHVMNGEISLESDVGQGTTVYLKVPVQAPIN